MTSPNNSSSCNNSPARSLGNVAGPPANLHAGGDSGRSTPPRIIQEMFQDYNDLGYKQSKLDLDTALEESCSIIVIEPIRLADETARWINFGNCLHKSSVIVGIASTSFALLYPKYWVVWAPCAGLSLASFMFYSICWQCDPCVHYQVLRDVDHLHDLQLHNYVNGSSVVVLVKKDELRRRLLHTTVAMVTSAVVGYRLWNMLK